MELLHRLLFKLIVTIVVIEVALLLLPVPPNVSKVQLLLVSLFSLNYFAAAVLFLRGVRGFKLEMIRAYRITTYSMVFFGLANLQYPLLVMANLIPGPWLAYGGSLAIVVPGVFLHYIGARAFMRALGVKSIWTSWTLLGGVTAAVCLLVALLPHVYEIPEPWFIFHQVSCAINMMLNLFTTAILFALVRMIGPAYRKALRWMGAAVALSTLGFIHVLVAALFGQDNAYTNAGVTAIPFIFVAIMYVVAGYQFCKIRFFTHKTDPTGDAILDAAILLASLVSNPADINHLTDQIRNITAAREPGKPLSTKSQEQLAQVCNELQTYLIVNERLQTFTADGLRSRLSDEVLSLMGTASQKTLAYKYNL